MYFNRVFSHKRYDLISGNLHKHRWLNSRGDCFFGDCRAKVIILGFIHPLNLSRKRRSLVAVVRNNVVYFRRVSASYCAYIKNDFAQHWWPEPCGFCDHEERNCQSWERFVELGWYLWERQSILHHLRCLQCFLVCTNSAGIIYASSV